MAPELEQIMGQTHPTPFATDVGQPTQQKAPEPSVFFDLTKHRLHNDLASGVPCTPLRCAHFRRQTLLRRRWRSARLGPRGMVPLALRGDVRVEAQALQRLHGSLTVRAIVQAIPATLDNGSDREA